MFRPKPLRPPFDPNLGQPGLYVSPRPTPRQMQMQAALRAAAPRGGGRGWQAGGSVLQEFTPHPRPPWEPPPYNPKAEELAAAFRAAQRAQGATARRANQAQRQASRSPGGWYTGGDVDVDPTEALMAERDRLQQQLQMADEVTAREIMAQIMEINKELEMAAAPGMAGGGLALLMGV